jgi:hypothetical protein
LCGRCKGRNDQVESGLGVETISIAKKNQRRRMAGAEPRDGLLGRPGVLIGHKQGAGCGARLEGGAKFIKRGAVFDGIAGSDQHGQAVACIATEIKNSGNHS